MESTLESSLKPKVSDFGLLALQSYITSIHY